MRGRFKVSMRERCRLVDNEDPNIIRMSEFRRKTKAKGPRSWKDFSRSARPTVMKFGRWALFLIGLLVMSLAMRECGIGT